MQLFAALSSCRLEWLADLLRENLPAELDFRREAENAKKCRELLQEGYSAFHFALPEPSLVRSFLIRLAASVVSWLGLPEPHSHFADNHGAQLAGTPPTLRSGVEGTAGNVSLVTGEQQHARALQLHSGSTVISTVHRQDDNSHCLKDYEVELYVPRVYNNLTTARVLVMERCQGVPVDDLRGIVSQGQPKLHKEVFMGLLGHVTLAVVTLSYFAPQEFTL